MLLAQRSADCVFMYESADVQNPIHFIIATQHHNYLIHLRLIQELKGQPYD